MALDDGSVTLSSGSWISVGIAWLPGLGAASVGIWTTLVKAAVLFRWDRGMTRRARSGAQVFALHGVGTIRAGRNGQLSGIRGLDARTR